MRRVAVDFAANSLLKDEVNAEARQWEKRRDEEEVEKFVERLERYIAVAEHPSCSQWRELSSPFWATREKIKDKTIDEAEAFLKEVAKDIGHIRRRIAHVCVRQWHSTTPN